MKIVVCVKQVCQVCGRSGLAPETRFLTPQDLVYRVNPYDEAAVSVAARIKGASDKTEVHLLTLGPLTAERELRRCAAMVEANDLFQIVSDADLDPRSKSDLLAQAIRNIGPDLVLCGKESIDTRHGQVGAFLAHSLGLPFVASIKELDISAEGKARVERSAGRGLREILESTLPAVFSVDMGAQALLLPSLEQKKRADRLVVRTLAFEEGAKPRTKRVGLHPPRPRPKKIAAPDSRLPAFERIAQLLSAGRVEKKGVVLNGTVESQVDGLLAFLKEHSLFNARNVPGGE
ncbi:MAG: electron transfer flavoprotein subunit beta/FixA family protein [Syntrophobacteraceae bacterium]|nr:electron transfer flavoprotein subunit beta/FixA family protein [Syntrophobacteraceae bacterium]